tara:strand:+ start:6850 stop:7389 length:540 start_codon:yes stop_codon:yes gene_type:complete
LANGPIGKLSKCTARSCIRNSPPGLPHCSAAKAVDQTIDTLLINARNLGEIIQPSFHETESAIKVEHPSETFLSQSAFGLQILVSIFLLHFTQESCLLRQILAGGSNRAVAHRKIGIVGYRPARAPQMMATGEENQLESLHLVEAATGTLGKAIQCLSGLPVCERQGHKIANVLHGGQI